MPGYKLINPSEIAIGDEVKCEGACFSKAGNPGLMTNEDPMYYRVTYVGAARNVTLIDYWQIDRSLIVKARRKLKEPVPFEKRCNVASSQWLCSLEKNHSGPHKAYELHTEDGKFLEQWRNEKIGDWRCPPNNCHRYKVSDVNTPNPPCVSCEVLRATGWSKNQRMADRRKS